MFLLSFLSQESLEICGCTVNPYFQLNFIREAGVNRSVQTLMAALLCDDKIILPSKSINKNNKNIKNVRVLYMADVH